MGDVIVDPRRRTWCGWLAAVGLAPFRHAFAQSPPALRVAWVSTDSKDAPSPNFAAFRDGMRELGYVEGRSVVIGAWWGDGSADRVLQLTPEILRTRPDVIVAAGGLALFALVRAQVKLPIVLSISADPVEAKIVDSFAHPGGNLTGISLFTLALVGKRLELIRDVLPHARRIALVANPQHPGERLEYETAQAAARQLGLAVRYFPVNSAGELEAALADIGRAHDDAILAFADGFTLGYASRIAAFSQTSGIPAVDGWAPFAEAGNLMIYGPVTRDVYRGLAGYVDRIAKGARPADMPIELPKNVELVVNAKAAKGLGITLPATVLARANRVIS